MTASLPGLVLSGGGARGAYQAGVLRGIAEALPAGSRSPFRVLAGASAGAINVAALAGADDNFRAASAALWEVWAGLDADQVFRTAPTSIAAIGLRWIRDLALGGAIGGARSTFLLDNAPLRALLGRRLDLDRLAERVRRGDLHAVAITATSYRSGAAVSFFAGDPALDEWTRSGRLGVRARLDVGHILASAAIPGFFPPEALGGGYWGDGCIRLTAPLSPAIHLGADRLLAIGIRHARTPGVTREEARRPMPTIAAVDVGGVLLNAVFLDALEADVERLSRINRTLRAAAEPRASLTPDHLREIPIVVVLPSQDLGALAAEELGRLPRTIRYMFRGLGASDEKGWDLLSYLAFDRVYTRRLLELGRADARAHTDAVVRLLA